MHDLVQEMGKEIVRQESPKEPGARSRLWFYEDILHVLQETTGTDKIEVLILNMPKGKEEVQWSEKAFEKMKNLKMLIIKNAYFSSVPTHLPNSLRLMDWNHYPGNVLPFDFHPTNLFSLGLPKSSLVSLKPFISKNMENLTIMNFSDCKFLRQVPDLSRHPNLEKLWLDNCPSLIEIHNSVGFLSKLTVLSAERCVNLTTLPHGIKLTSLQKLALYGCSSLQTFPEVLGKMEKTREIHLQETAIEELPYSIQNITSLLELYLSRCQRLQQLPASLLKLPKLYSIKATDCERLRHFSKLEGAEGKEMSSIESSSSKIILDFRRCSLSDESFSLCLSLLLNVKYLDLSYNTITILPICMEECHHLKELDVTNCEQLQLIEGMPPNLEVLRAHNCLSLTFQSSSKLMHQAFCGPGERQFFLPGEKVPEWFHHYSDGYSMEFWVRKEFPKLAVCCVVIATSDDIKERKNIFLYVNGRRTWSTFLHSDILFPLKGNHIFLCHVKGNSFEVELDSLFLPNQWNHVGVYGLDNGTIKSIGVHVYEQENVQFSRPTPSNRTWDHVYGSKNDLVLKKKRLMAWRQQNINSNKWLSLHTSWQEHPVPYVVDSNSITLDSTRDTISDQDGAPMQTSSEKQPYKIEMEIGLPTIPPPQSTTAPVLEKDLEENGLSNNEETANPPNFKTSEVCLNTSMDLEALNKMIKEDPMSAIESLLTKNISVSSEMHQFATQSGEPAVQISSFEALQKELKSLLTKFDLSSLFNMHRSNIYFYIEDLEKKFESLPPAHLSFIMNFRSFFVNAASNYDKLNDFRRKEFQLVEEKENLEKKLQEVRAKDEKMTALVSSASLRVKEIVSSIKEPEGQLMKLKQEKEAFELAINECGKQKKILRTECISWAYQSADLDVELTEIEKITQLLEDQVEANETNYQELIASIPF